MVSRAYGKSLLGRPKLIRSPNPTLQDYLVGLGPFAYWPLSETSGTVAVDIVGGYHGTYNNVTLNATTFPDGSAAPLFDASNERVSLDAAALDTPFDPTKGTVAAWLRVRAASVWTDGVARIPLSFGADASNRVYNTKSSTSNRFDWAYVAGGTSELNIQTSFSPATWIHVCQTWDITADQSIAYLNGAAIGNLNTGLGTWAGALATGFTAIGNFTSAGGANFWDGYIKHVAAFNRVLTPAEIAGMVPANFLL